LPAIDPRKRTCAVTRGIQTVEVQRHVAAELEVIVIQFLLSHKKRSPADSGYTFFDQITLDFPESER
jgi:hypothetical protein